MSFDAAAYLAQNPDIVAYAANNGLDPTAFAAQHWNTTGQAEVAAGGRQAGFAVNPTPQTAAPAPAPAPAAAAPAANFNVAAYLAANPDIVAYAQRTGQDPNAFGVQHYNSTGASEIAAGTRTLGAGTAAGAAPAAAPTPVTIPSQANPTSAVGMAQLAAALAAQQQQTTAPVNPFAVVGADAFDPAGYLALNPDVAQYATANGLDPTKFAADHYNQVGKTEGRQYSATAAPSFKAADRIDEPGRTSGAPSAALTPQPTTPASASAFDAKAYLEQNPDIASAANVSGVDPMQFAVNHYNSTGKNEIAAGTRFANAKDAAAPRVQKPVTPGATWADFYTKVPGVQDWAIKAMQAEWQPSGWAGGPIDSMEEAAAAYQSIYGDGGTGISFAAKDPTKYLYDPEHPDLNTRGLLDAGGNVQVIDAKALANPEVKASALQIAEQAAPGITQTAATASQPKWADYIKTNPDLLAAAQAQGLTTDAQLADLGRKHYIASGQKEGRAVPGLAAGQAAPPLPSYVNPNFDYAAYSAGKPELMKAGTTLTLDNGKTITPGTDFYVVKTNTGDISGVIGANEGQAVALLDPKTEEVLFYGVGPEAAAQAAAMANSISQDKGRKSAWQLAVDHEGTGNWQLAAWDKKDPKTSVLGAVADIVLPVVASILMPGSGLLLAGVGAAAGSAVSSIAQGRGLKETLMRAAGSGLAAGLLPMVPGMDQLGSALGNIPGVGALGQGLGKIDAFGNSLFGGAAGSGASGALSGAVGSSALAGGAAGDALTTGALSAIGAPTSLVTASSNILGSAASKIGEGLVTEVVVTAARNGIYQALASGATAAVAQKIGEDILRNGVKQRPEDFQVDELSVTAAANKPIPLAAIAASAAPPSLVKPSATVEEVVVTPRKEPDLTAAAGAAAGGILGNAANNVIDGVKKNPLGAAGMALLLADALGGGGGGSKYSSNFTGGTRPGTRESLDGIFNESDLPEAGANFAARGGTGYRADETYGFGPEAAFFSGVQGGGGGGGSPFAARTPAPQAQTALSGVNFSGEAGPHNASFMAWVGEQPEDVKEVVREILRRQGKEVNFAAGGGVRGPGTGRSDSIDANLSDGEYVIDAETVALLGDGSSNAGAKQLDQFRVNVRKHKGRELARGSFSAKAHQPERYLGGV